MKWAISDPQSETRRGTILVEFVLSVALILTPLILGTMMIGMNILRSLQVTQLNRDAGHMYARGVDFAVSSNAAILTQLAGGLNLSSGGKSVVILSTMLKVGTGDCTGCANLGKLVFVRQITIGNPALHSSAYGRPTVDSNDNVTNYLTSSSAVATGFDPTVMALNASETVYVAESFYRSSELDLPGFVTNSGVFARGIF
jgi:hypothetical protein